MDNSREQFEEWIKAERPKLFLDLLETDPTRYSDPATERLWQSWQASRQAIEIDLTDWFSPNDGGDKAVWVDQIEKQFMAKGLKIKEVP